MDNSGWILTSERLPDDGYEIHGRTEVWVWCISKANGFGRCHSESVDAHKFIAWRPIDPPPAFVPPPVYRDVVMPDDWGKECEFSDTEIFHKPTNGRLAGCDHRLDFRFWAALPGVQSAFYRYARIRVTP